MYWGEIAPYIKFRHIWISVSWGFNLRFNYAVNWSYKGFRRHDRMTYKLRFVVFFRFHNQVLFCCNGFVLRYLSKLVLFLLILFLLVYYYHIWDIWLLFESFSSLSYFFCFQSVLVQTKVRFVISSLNRCSSSRKLYSCCVFVFFYFSYLCHVFSKGEGT